MLIIKPPDLITLEIRINWISLWSWVLSFKRKVQQAFVILLSKNQTLLKCEMHLYGKTWTSKARLKRIFSIQLCVKAIRAEVTFQYLSAFQLLILIWGMFAVRPLLTGEMLLVKSGEAFVFRCLNTTVVRIKVAPKLFNIHYYYIYYYGLLY